MKDKKTNKKNGTLGLTTRGDSKYGIKKNTL